MGPAVDKIFDLCGRLKRCEIGGFARCHSRHVTIAVNGFGIGYARRFVGSVRRCQLPAVVHFSTIRSTGGRSPRAKQTISIGERGRLVEPATDGEGVEVVQLVLVARHLQRIADGALRCVRAASAYHTIRNCNHQGRVAIAAAKGRCTRRRIHFVARDVWFAFCLRGLAHVPHAHIAAPHRRVVGGLRLGRVAPVHRDLGAVGEGRNSHPDVGIAARVPRVDFAFKDVVPLRVRREPHVRAFRLVSAVGVAEAVAPVGQAYQRLEVRQRLGSGVAAARQRHRLLRRIRRKYRTRGDCDCRKYGANSLCFHAFCLSLFC